MHQHPVFPAFIIQPPSIDANIKWRVGCGAFIAKGREL
jgi:hypothetical protein